MAYDPAPMGEQNVSEEKDEDESRAFVKALLADVRALEQMIENDLFETGKRRVGAEQEMFLVDADLRPASVAVDVLGTADDPRLTHELALFNLEANVPPRVFEASCLSDMERDIRSVVAVANEAAAKHGAQVVLAGILPTLRRTDLTLAAMTPSPRYRALNDTLLKMRGGDFLIDIRGLDELNVTHDNVMFEACNTSFQVHFQCTPEEFPKLYNVAQLVTAPVLAVAANSPLFLGSRLWHETRVALFSSSIDERSGARRERGLRPRVTFGDHWVRESVLEIFREQIARFRVLLSAPTDADPLEVLGRGEVPALSALRLHNGTVYRWNRACYGISEGRAHLRIENRVFPAGPTILDEVANAAFFFGLMSAVTEEIGDPRTRMDFDAAKDNFYAAARHGLKAQFTWLDGKTLTAAELIKNRLLPRAREGLRRSKIDEGDIERYLGVIESRVSSGRTGATWAFESLASMRKDVRADMRDRFLVSATLEHQKADKPVHEWDLCEVGAILEEAEEWRRGLQYVGQFMSKDLFTVRPDDLVDLAASVMEWEHIKHLPVEDDEGHLLGLVTHRDLLRLVARGKHDDGSLTVVREIMIEDPVTVSPDTPTLEAMKMMRERRIGSLPVVEGGKLVGIITQSDLVHVSAGLLERFLQGGIGGTQP